MITNDNFGVIEQIDISKFKCGGSVYIEKNITEDTQETSIQVMISKMCFNTKISDITNKVESDREDKTLNARTEDVESFLKEKGGDLLDIIVFPDGGFRNNNHIVMEENSILFIKLKNNIKLGFFINKSVAKAIIGGYDDVSTTE